jgi:2-polyprenyl-3-methyl-5-hydroxy-6-metoxy-1,4-benzoquinol methylase
LNRDWWDERVPVHVAPNGYYRTERFEADRSFLSADVRLDKPLLGDIAGLRGIHLQCHIGTDTISLSRLGARMTGLDYSSEAVAQARALAARVGANVDFIESDVYDAPRFVEPASFAWCTPSRLGAGPAADPGLGPRGGRSAAARRAAVHA